MLKVENLNVAYGQSHIIYDINFEVKAGEIVAVMGRNGMGKSTLLKSLVGMVKPKSGTVTVDNVDVTMLESYQHVNNGIAFVPQGRHIFSGLTVEENILSGLRIKANKRELMTEVYSMFHVLYDMKHRKAGNLSGGQQQQLAIARALVAEPKVLILDEPTEGIQPSIIKDLARQINSLKLAKNLAIVVSEQVLSFTIDITDKMYVIESGKFILEDTKGNFDIEKITKYLSV